MEDMRDDLSISCFFPCYNDGGTIASMVIGTLIVLDELGLKDYEVIVIDDGSSDASRSILKRLENDYPGKVRVVYHDANRGYGGALRSGFAAARKDLIFYTDGDAQYDVRELKKLVEALDQSTDIVQGYKIKRLDPWYRVVIGKTYQYLMKLVFGLGIKDVDCDFRLIRRSVFDKVRLEKTSGVICLEMMKKMQDAGFSFKEVPVNHFFRAYGTSQFFRVGRVLRVSRDVAYLWWELVGGKFFKGFLHGRPEKRIQGR